jgi:hypothetical protein
MSEHISLFGLFAFSCEMPFPWGIRNNQDRFDGVAIAVSNNFLLKEYRYLVVIGVWPVFKDTQI